MLVYVGKALCSEMKCKLSSGRSSASSVGWFWRRRRGRQGGRAQKGKAANFHAPEDLSLLLSRLPQCHGQSSEEEEKRREEEDEDEEDEEDDGNGKVLCQWERETERRMERTATAGEI